MFFRYCPSCKLNRKQDKHATDAFISAHGKIAGTRVYNIGLELV